MSLNFYTDTHISKHVAIQLRSKGVDIVRCEEVGLANASDSEHLEYATRHNRVMVSVDHHFVALHAKWLSEGKHHAGIIRVLPHVQGNIGTIVKALLEYHDLIEIGAGTIQADIHDRLFYIG